MAINFNYKCTMMVEALTWLLLILASNKLTTKFGLFSIRERMRALGGSFEIETAPDRGTTATLSLPLSAASSTTEEELMLVEALREGSGKDSHHSLPSGEHTGTVGVLLVDDHAMVRQGLRTMLGKVCRCGSCWRGV